MVSRHPVHPKVATVLMYYHQAGRLTPLTARFECAPSKIKEACLLNAKDLERTPAPAPGSMGTQLRIAQQTHDSMDASQDD